MNDSFYDVFIADLEENSSQITIQGREGREER